MGEMNITSIGGAKYFLLFKDDFSHFRTVYFMKSKSEAANKLETFIKLIENQFDKKVKCLRSDNGTEIKNANTKRLLDQLGIFHSKSSAYTPQQNGRVEREMRTVVESARSVIHMMNLDENLWAEAINYAIFTLNQTGTSSQANVSPAELWFGRRMNPNKLRSFGCKCYVLVPDHKRNKLSKKSQKGIFVGYDVDSSCYRVYIPELRDVISSVNVIFDEQKETETSYARTSLDNEGRETEESDQDEHSEDGESDTSESEYSETREEPQQRTLRDRQNLRMPIRYADYQLSQPMRRERVETAMIGETQDISVKEALNNENWVTAMKEEYESLIKMKTWKLVYPPNHAKPLTCRWVLREKQDGRHKARLVARGFEQREGVDYTETFSPVARYDSIRLILSIAASREMKLANFDVRTAFLYGDLKEEIYMEQPEGFKDGTNRVCKLQKSLYGLKQAPKIWNEKISNYFKSKNFNSTDDDPCIYYNKDRSILIVLFVDDGLIAVMNEKDMYKTLNQLNEKFEITYDGTFPKTMSYLGMEIEQKLTGIFVSQSKYTNKIIQRFNLENSNSASTPMERGMVTSQGECVNDEPVSKSVPYREAVGSLLYLCTISRPDISFAVNYVSRFNNQPMVSHWKMVKRILQYLKGTSVIGIFFDGDKTLKAYTDSDYGGDSVSGRSTSGVLIMRGGPIVWSTQKQRLVATSTAEAEYRAAVSAIDEICWIRRLGRELNVEYMDQPTTLFVDNQSAVHMLKNTSEGRITKGKKHIDISRKFIKEHVGVTVQLQHVKSANQLADILTKPLNKKVFEDMKRKIIKEEC